MRTPVVRTRPKTIMEIGKEWDDIVPARQCAIEDGKDVSFSSVTAPCILRYIKEDLPSSVLDVGCGSGALSFRIAALIEKCVGIDISAKSISIAKENYIRTNLTFINSEIRSFRYDTCFDACVANMVFMSDPNWRESVRHLYEMLKVEGTLYLTITHPCFWARYWEFENEEWFNYNEEIFLESNFSISLKRNMGKSTYIHRPIANYFNGLVEEGFTLDLVEEPYPIQNTIPEYDYFYPRFLFIKCKKQN